MNNIKNPIPEYILEKQPKFSIWNELFSQMDWTLFIVVISLSLIGIFEIFSATSTFKNPLSFFLKQLLGIGIGIVLMFIFATINYEVFYNLRSFLLLINFFLLIGVLFFGKEYHGTKGWYTIGPLSFQPSEFTKISLILINASYLIDASRQIKVFTNLLKVFVFTGITMGLILLQPDFSSSLIYFPVLLCLLLVYKMKKWIILLLLVFGITSFSVPILKTILQFYFANSKNSFVLFFIDIFNYNFLNLFIFLLFIGVILIFLWYLLFKLMFRVDFSIFVLFFIILSTGISSGLILDKSLKDYQRKRLTVFFNTEIDTLGAGYNILQSKIAVGSGKIFGKGYFNSSQAKLGFLPAQHTDFIFSVIGEEFGFIGSLTVVSLFLVFFFRIKNIMLSTTNPFAKMIVTGLGGMFAFYIIFNIGMTIGILPVIGVPLPFLSYGGSTIVTNFIAIGILQNIYLRRNV